MNAISPIDTQKTQADASELAASLDIPAQRIGQLQGLFPEAFTEGKIDLKRLADLLGDNVASGRENYELTWGGKSEARREIQKRTTATLRPDTANSVNWDSTQNLYIEGENLEVLRTLQKAYFGKVKMIYIDPPYNTGSDSFVYPDDYSERLSEYRARTGQTDEAGFVNKQDMWKKNVKENGQFHSVWLSMMYPRLFLARNLLRDDGVIFVSIDDNEVANLKLLMDEIFGAENFEATIIPISNPGGRDYKQVAITHEYLMVYSKSQKSELNELQKDVGFPFFDSKGGYQPRELRNRNPKFNSQNRPRLFYPYFVNPNNTKDGYCH
jgi:adenine-specific DNA-methyltransferase